MWAFAKAGHASLIRFDAIAQEVKACVKDLGSQNLANIVRAFATAGHSSSVLFDATAEVPKACSKNYKSQELANT
eukprot:5130576-Karenia_brevis.AAC.1